MNLLVSIRYIPSKIYQPNDVQSIATDFTSRLAASADACFGPPSAPSSALKKRTPWWNENCRIAVRDRRRAFRLFQRRPTMVNLEEYLNLTDVAKNTIEQSKKRLLAGLYIWIDSHYPTELNLEEN